MAKGRKHKGHCADKKNKYHRKYHYVGGKCLTGKEYAKHKRHHKK